MSTRHDGAIWTRCDRDERPLLVASNPDAYRLTPHFERSPGYLLIWLEHVDEAEVRERLTTPGSSKRPNGWRLRTRSTRWGSRRGSSPTSHQKGQLPGAGWSIRRTAPAGTSEVTYTTVSTLPSLRTRWTSSPLSTKPDPAWTRLGVQWGSSPL